MKEFMNKVKSFFGKIGAGIKKAWSVSGGVAVAFIKKYWNIFSNWLHEKTSTKKFKFFMDKVTTGLLIFLMCSPVLILGYIFLWFILNIS